MKSGLNSNDLAEAVPNFQEFYPSEQILNRLIEKAAKIKFKSELWHGYDETIDKYGVTYFKRVPEDQKYGEKDDKCVCPES